ncbi:MAG: ATP phosphoribosyltransferase regulatory subunit [Christensenellales bacterium]
MPRLFGGEEVFAQAAPLCSDDASSKTLAYLHELYRALVDLGLGDRMIVDLGLVQRNDYYTDVIFSAYVENVGDAVLFGGRYDNLLAQFDADACGRIWHQRGCVGRIVAQAGPNSGGNAGGNLGAQRRRV